MSQFNFSSKPDLSGFTDRRMWELAEKQALRSPLRGHRTGAVVFDRYGRILSKGVARPVNHSDRLEHAEEHACKSMWPALSSLNAEVVIVTLSTGGGWSWSSQPCASCSKILKQFNIQRVHYAERVGDDTWIRRTYSVDDLFEAAKNVPLSKFACKMRVNVA